MLNYSPKVKITDHIRKTKSPQSSVQLTVGTRPLKAAGSGKSEKSEIPGFGNVVSTLFIERVTGFHSGNYTCSPSNARAASVMVHVVDGECCCAHAHIILVFFLARLRFSECN